jgi:hypothetical protein
VIKTDPDGDTVWTRTFGGTDYDWGYSVGQTSDGGYIISGGASSYGEGKGDILLVKVHPDGSTMWTRTYGGTSAEFGFSVRQTADGGYVIAGSTSSFGEGLHDVYLIKTDENGIVE